MLRTIVLSGALVAVAGLAFAGGHGGNPAVKARKSHMELYEHNLGTFFAMLKGDAEYSPEAASAAASNLMKLTELSQGTYWPQGTSVDELGDETRALPVIWTQDGFAKIMEISGALNEAIANLNNVAGDGVETLGPAAVAVGNQCNACHEAFRKPRG